MKITEMYEVREPEQGLYAVVRRDNHKTVVTFCDRAIADLAQAAMNYAYAHGWIDGGADTCAELRGAA